MIHKIGLENFFSIADYQEVDFSIARNAPDRNSFVVSRGNPKARLPLIVGFFGANASGKTTMLRSIISVLSFVIGSFSLKPDDIIPFLDSYARKDWLHKPTKILIEFDCIMPNSETEYLFRYELIVGRKDNQQVGAAQFVLSEKLDYMPRGKWKMLFERKNQSYKFGKEFNVSEKDPRLATIRSNASLLSTLAQFNHKESLAFLDFVSTTRTNIVGFKLANDDAKVIVDFYRQNPDFLASLNKQIRRVDIGIEHIDISEGPNGAYFVFHHIGLSRPIYFENESHGTQRFISIFPRIKNALDTGSLALIDELDSVLHPTLISELFSWFEDKSKNPNKAQLIFAAHNPIIFDMLEKEQIYLAEKRSSDATQVYGLKDIKGLRREPKLAKKYLAGEFGGLPLIG